MADRGTVKMTATAPLVGVAVYNGPHASVLHANFDGVGILKFGGDGPPPPEPKTTGQIWPRGEL